MGIPISALPALGMNLPADAELEVSYQANSYKITGQEIADGGGGGGGPAAWATFQGASTPALLGSHNILSLAEINTGHYKLTFATSLATSSYAAVFGTQREDSGAPFVVAAIGQGESPDFDGTRFFSSADVPFPGLAFNGSRGVTGTVEGDDYPSVDIYGFTLPDVGFTEVACKVAQYTPGIIGGKVFGCFVGKSTSPKKYTVIGTYTNTGAVKAWTNGSEESVAGGGTAGIPGYYKISFVSGTSWELFYSADGISWTSAVVADIGGTADVCGFGMLSYQANLGTFTIQVLDFETDTQPPGIPAKTAGHCYVETFDPTTGVRIDAPLACAAFFE